MPRMRLFDELSGEPLMEDTKLFVCSLSWGTTNQGLVDALSWYDNVTVVSVLIDRSTCKSHSFGFIRNDAAN